jgi:phosphoglycerate dehydrogenase-like enzyme
VDYVDSAEIRVLRGQPNYDEARKKVVPPSAELRSALAEAHIVLAVDLPFDMHLLAPDLRWVQSVGAGVAQLQTCGLDKLGVQLTSSAGVASDPIAEFVIARILAHWKLFPLYELMQRERRWVPTFGRNLAGSVLGIVGFGAIGQAVAWRAKALGMRVLATRRQLQSGSSDPSVDCFYPARDLNEMLELADAVVLCASETPQTYQMFDADTFAAMKERSYFCNVSRGSLVDENALRSALENGRLAGASIDVATVEPLPPDSPLWDAPNLAISPHSAATIERFFPAVWDLFYDNMTRYLAGTPLKNLRGCSYGG